MSRGAPRPPQRRDDSATPWRTWALVALAVVGTTTLLALVVLPTSVLDPVERIEAGEAALGIGFAILALDAVAPVPSSAAMIALGAFAGFWAAAVVSTAGLLAGAVVGYGLGRAGARLSRRDPTVSPDHTRQSHRRAIVAVIVSRSIPLVAETTAVTAGAVRMRLALFVPAALVGGVVPAAAYAAIGSGLTDVSSTWLIAGSTVVLVAVAAGAHRLAAARS